jgi:hypothetical protein
MSRYMNRFLGGEIYLQSDSLNRRTGAETNDWLLKDSVILCSDSGQSIIRVPYKQVNRGALLLSLSKVDQSQSLSE